MIRTCLTICVSFSLAWAGFNTALAGTGKYEMCPETLDVAVTLTYPPFQYTDDNGNMKGFDVAIMRALCDKMTGVSCDYHKIDWAGVIPAIKADKFDTAIVSMAATKQRDKHVDFTIPYYQATGNFIGPKNMEVEISKEGLKGMTVGAQRATTQVRLLKDKFGDAIDIKTYPTQKDVNMELVNGRIDLMIGDTLMLEKGFLSSQAGQAYEKKGPTYSDPKYYGDGTSLTIREGDDRMRRCLNTALKTIHANGTHDRISKKHFGRDIYDR